MTFTQAWSQPGGRVCPEDLCQVLVADLTGTKRAALPADSDGLLKVMWDGTRACWGSGSSPISGMANVPMCVVLGSLHIWG